MSEIVIRHAAPEDAADLHRILMPIRYRSHTLLSHWSIHALRISSRASKDWSPALMTLVVGSLSLEVNSRARRASFGICVDNHYRQRGECADAEDGEPV